MRFANPIFLALAAAVPLAGLWWTFLMARREKALGRITLSVPKARAAGLQMALVLAGLFLSLFAASRPQWGKATERTVERSRNVVVAIDVSRSMLAQDVRPNRLGRAKADVADLIDSLEGDRCPCLHIHRLSDWRNATLSPNCPDSANGRHNNASLPQASMTVSPFSPVDHICR